MNPDDVLTLLRVLLVIAGVCLVIAGIVYAVQRARSGQGITLPLRQLFNVYLYLMTILSLLLTVSGLSSLVQAGLAVPLGKEFSYYTPDYPRPVYIPAPPTIDGVPAPAKPQLTPTPEEQEKQRQDTLNQAFKDGMVKGLSLTVVGGILWAIHWRGKRRMTEKDSLMGRLYLVVLLFVFAALTLSSLPTGIYETVRYYVVGSQTQYSGPVTPGAKLSTAIVSLPIWLIYLFGAMKQLRGAPKTG